MAPPGELRCATCRQSLRSDAPAGLCPRCLLTAAVAAGRPAPLDDAAGPGADFESPGPLGAGAEPSGPRAGWYLPADPVEAVVERARAEALVADLGTASPVLPANVQSDDYEILRELSRSAAAVVYLARQRSPDRPVALKVLETAAQAGDTGLPRFQRDAEAAARLRHPGIVPIYEAGMFAGQPYFSMAYVEGQSLSKRLAEGPLPPSRAAELVRDVARAVHYAHTRGVIHGNVKPSNILVDKNGHARVTDFGMATRLDVESTSSRSDAVRVTPGFLAPEQARGQNDRVGACCDVYSLGATLYALLTARPPFQASTALDTLRQIYECDPAPPARLNAEIDRNLETVCLKCLDKEPSRRYPTAEALAADLGRWLRHEPIEARSALLPLRLLRWGRRRPAMAAAGVAILAALATIAGLGVRDIQRSRTELAAAGKAGDDTQRRLVRSAIASGDRLAEDGNLIMALPWYVHALKNEPDGAAAQERHRIRIASVLDAAPRLARLELTPLDRAEARSGAAGPGPIWVPLRRDLPGRPVQGTFVGDGRRFVTVQEIDPPAEADATAEVRSEISVWDAATGAPVAGPAPFSLAGVRVEPSSRGERLLVRGHHVRLASWSVERGGSECYLLDARTLETILPRSGEVLRVACFSPDGQIVLAAPALDGRVGPGAAPDRTWPGEPVDLDGSSSNPGTGAEARIYNAGDGATRGSVLKHEMPIARLAFAPDGQTAISSGGNFVRLWDVATWRLLAAGLPGYSFLCDTKSSM